jgi:thiamine-monophosphate kinase
VEIPVNDSVFDPDEMPAWLQGLWPKSESRSRSIIAGINEDDCAVLRLGNRLVILSTDYLNARPIAVELGIGTERDLGRLLVDANVSDLCGSGARPEALLIAITLTYNSSANEFREIMLGVRDETSRLDITVVGGDTKLGVARSLLAVAVGSAEEEDQLFLRRNAKKGDELWVSGSLGACNAGVVVLTQMTSAPDSWKDWARSAILRPSVPVGQSRALSDARLANGGTDISDGLGAALMSLSRASGAAAIIQPNQIPVEKMVNSVAQALGVPAYAFAFTGGGDCQFIVSARQEAGTELERLGFQRIGFLDASDLPRVVIEGAGQLDELATQGHRDARNLSFKDEIARLLTRLRV